MSGRIESGPLGLSAAREATGLVHHGLGPVLQVASESTRCTTEVSLRNARRETP